MNIFRHLSPIHFSPNEGSEGENKEQGEKQVDKLSDAINKAMDNLETPEEKEELVKPEKKEKEKEKEKETEEEEDDEDEIDPEEAKKAITLLRMLNDPKSSRETIALLAKQVGLDTDSTKTEKKEAIKSLKEMFKESLGPDLEFMSDSLYAAMEKFTNQVIESKTKDIKDTLAAQQQEKQMAKLEEGYDKVESTFSNFNDVSKEIFELSKTIKIQSDQSPEAYFKMLYYTACGEKGVTPTKVKSEGKDKIEINKDKLERARREANSRVASERDNVKEEETLPQPKNLKEAIAMAIKQVDSRKK